MQKITSFFPLTSFKNSTSCSTGFETGLEPVLLIQIWANNSTAIKTCKHFKIKSSTRWLNQSEQGAQRSQMI